MSSESPDAFLAAVREAGLLDPARLAELAAWADKSLADMQGLVAEILRRGWLTPYQIKEVHRGRGAGLTLGRYALLDLLGEGGMGRVFKALDTRLGREVALKVIRKEKLTRPSVLRRFQREMEAAAKLSHPNVVLAFDADEANGVHFYAMEYVEGTDLTKLVQSRGPLAVPQACDYVRQAALGLQHAAEQGLVHRDVKPSNLLVTPRGQVKVLDLGLALLKGDAGAEGDGRVTQHGLVLGTPDFLAPEQARNPLGVDTRADVYALGGTLYFLLTGRPPYEGESATEKLVRHVSAPPPSLLAHRPDAPPQLDAVVQWMMAKRPEDRPQTPAQAAMALVPFCAPVSAIPLAAAQSSEPVPVIEPVVIPRRRKPAGGPGVKVLLLALAALCGLGIFGAVGYFLVTGLVRPPAPEPRFTNSVGMKMVLVPGGSFVMGSPEGEPGRRPDEGPAGEVAVSGPFYVAATEVSNGQFTAVMGKSPAVHPRRRRNPGQTPVDSVTWDEAAEFCRRLTAKEPDRRAGWGYRLPTEAEWEYACRAGTTTPFWSGDKLVLGRGGIFDLDKDQREKSGLGEADPGQAAVEKYPPFPVGSTTPNPFGLSDTHGNVWEWCADYYAPDYADRAATDPKGPAKGELRVLRGGSWKESAARCRSAARRGLSPTAREDDVGFRVVYAPLK